MIKGSTLRDAFISGANGLAAHRKQIDALNVFPVPDGDTGTNLSMTMGAAKHDLSALSNTAGASEVAGAMAEALLWGARGNSGVILSLLFRGFAKGMAEKDEVGAPDLVNALEQGVEAAYKAVMKPTEGTMLTVARESAAHAAQVCEKNPTIQPDALWAEVIIQAEKTLANTPELLPVLKKAGVVDAGGKGLCVIFSAMGQVFAGGEIYSDEQAEPDSHADAPTALGEYEGEITFTYCTEFVVVKDKEKANAPALREYLESIGDSVVTVDDTEIIKCHLHTNDPGDALQKGLQSGNLTKIKIENMREQQLGKQGLMTKAPSAKFPYKPVDPSREYGFVAVAAGQGVQTLFKELGVENVVSGGQTMTPSTDNILEAIHATPAKNVIVLPNNKNIIMAAEQAVRLADRSVYVLPTKTIPQGLSAMLAFDPEAPLSDNQLSMVKASKKVGTGLITFAARDCTFDGHKIKKGGILALENGKLSFTEKDCAKAVLRLTRSLVKRDSTFVTLIYGEGISEEQAEEAEKAISAKLPDSVELTMINGGQPVYYYMIGVE